MISRIHRRVVAKKKKSVFRERNANSWNDEGLLKNGSRRNANRQPVRRKRTLCMYIHRGKPRITFTDVKQDLKVDDDHYQDIILIMYKVSAR